MFDHRLNRPQKWLLVAGIIAVFSICGTFVLAALLPEMSATMRPRAIALGIVISVLGWLATVLAMLSYYHNQTREKLLEIQHQLTELAEQMRRQEGSEWQWPYPPLPGSQ